jgi:hypothetical protein
MCVKWNMCLRWRYYWSELCSHVTDSEYDDNGGFEGRWVTVGSYLRTECVYSLYDSHCKQQLFLSAVVTDCHEDVLCFLWGKKWIFKYCLDEFHISNCLSTSVLLQCSSAMTCNMLYCVGCDAVCSDLNVQLFWIILSWCLGYLGI